MVRCSGRVNAGRRDQTLAVRSTGQVISEDFSQPYQRISMRYCKLGRVEPLADELEEKTSVIVGHRPAASSLHLAGPSCLLIKAERPARMAPNLLGARPA